MRQRREADGEQGQADHVCLACSPISIDQRRGAQPADVSGSSYGADLHDGCGFPPLFIRTATYSRPRTGASRVIPWPASTEVLDHIPVFTRRERYRLRRAVDNGDLALEYLSGVEKHRAADG